ncbi:pentapeptide repeat-containing protein [Enterovibrio norvegicus]|uniref:ion channel n=1 Tax=Enterovibrio norvegicus TaxID=188144 RepID=UPI000C844E0E|nr:ion channel [Enterovibrio norvegicus]PMI26229.1 potassium transporter Kef [Enterovibrio norvegicus]TKF13921.1 pentapeptide repeat-containing protein [Enterovibrio norvegicus]
MSNRSEAAQEKGAAIVSDSTSSKTQDSLESPGAISSDNVPLNISEHPEPHPHTCQYLDPDGKTHACSGAAGESGFCFWHDENQPKDQEDIKEQLEAYAKQGGQLRGIIVKRADLKDVNLVRHGPGGGYDLSYANFYRSNMTNAHLFNAKFDNGSLMKADLHDANIHCASFINCNLLGVKLTDTKIDNIKIGTLLQQESEGRVAERKGDLEKALDLYEQSEEIYRDLRKASEAQGIFTMAGYFLQKELTMRRFQMPMFSTQRAMSKTVDLFCGYGESPIRVIFFSLALILWCAIIYFYMGIQFAGETVAYSAQQTFADNFWAFSDCLYYSVVTFTTLGYGDFIPIGMSRLIAATEAFTGSFTIALFVVVFVKKMTR